MIGRWVEVASRAVYAYPDGGAEHSASYLVVEGDCAILVDPSVGLSVCPHGLTFVGLLLTHGHADHWFGLNDYRPASPLWLHPGDETLFADPRQNGSIWFGRSRTPAPADRTLSDDQLLTLGAHTTLRVVATPGHTAGSVCLIVAVDERPVALLTGDTLFADSVGRTDLPGGSAVSLDATLRTLKARLSSLPATLPVGPGHGRLTTIERLLRYNPYLIRA